MTDVFAPFRGECRSCRAPVLWARTVTNDRMMPISADPVDDGNVLLTVHPQTGEPGPRRLSARVLGAMSAAQIRASGTHLYLPHFVDCPYALTHRKARR